MTCDLSPRGPCRPGAPRCFPAWPGPTRPWRPRSTGRKRAGRRRLSGAEQGACRVGIQCVPATRCCRPFPRSLLGLCFQSPRTRAAPPPGQGGARGARPLPAVRPYPGLPARAGPDAAGVWRRRRQDPVPHGGAEERAVPGAVHRQQRPDRFRRGGAEGGDSGKTWGGMHSSSGVTAATRGGGRQCHACKQEAAARSQCARSLHAAVAACPACSLLPPAPPGSACSRGPDFLPHLALQDTPCEVHTFDCTWNGSSIHPDRHTYHKIW